MSSPMEHVKIVHDRTGNTLTVWFGNPQDEYLCEETGDEVMLMKDRTGSSAEQLSISFETASV